MKKTMKNIITFVTILLSTGLFAQHKVSQKITSLQSEKAVFRKFTVLNEISGISNPKIISTVDDATMATINLQSANDIATNKYETIEVAFPYRGNTISVSLYRANPFNQNFHVDTNKQKSVDYEKGVYYRGMINGNPNSVASFNFFQNKLSAIVSSSELGNIVLGKLETQGNVSNYIVYSDANLKIPNSFRCGVKDDESRHVTGDSPEARESLSEKCVTMYLEVDFDLFSANNGSVEETTDWVTAVFNNVQTLYENDGITVSLKSLYIWTEPDPYFGEQSSDYLYQFNSQTPVFDGDVGQLIGLDGGGLGGVAVGIDGLCSQNNFSYSDVEFGFNSVPVYSWTVEVITHEFGHLLGSPHTHACVWNGNGTAIDNCAPLALGNDWEGGDCMTSPPTIPYAQKGTIMSYCHLVGGAGISFNNGFGEQPGQLILNTVNSSNCLSTDCINTCINTVANITITNVSPTAVTVTWNDLGDTASQWEVAVMPYTQSSAPYITVNTNSFTTTVPLLPNTYYKVRVRPICDSATPPSRQVIFATAAPWCNGAVITDTGGLSNEYGNEQLFVRTIIPNQPSKKIRLDFTEFNLEEDFDYLTIYDGASTSAANLGSYTGTFIQDSFVSTAPDGSLTLQFFSDQLVTESGFAATVSCEENLATGEFTPNIDFTYFPNPTNGFVNILSQTLMTQLTVYNITGQLLFDSNVNALETKVDVSSFATGAYFFKLKFGEKEANFKILKN
jgi:hypothetical protein